MWLEDGQEMVPGSPSNKAVCKDSCLAQRPGSGNESQGNLRGRATDAPVTVPEYTGAQAQNGSPSNAVSALPGELQGLSCRMWSWVVDRRVHG